MLANLRSLRTERGISQQKLADALGISQQSVNKYENHAVEPDIATIIRMADYFCVSVDYLVGRSANRASALCVGEFSIEEVEMVRRCREASPRDREIIRLLLGR